MLIRLSSISSHRVNFSLYWRHLSMVVVKVIKITVKFLLVTENKPSHHNSSGANKTISHFNNTIFKMLILATYFKNFSQKDRLCLILRTDVERVRGSAATFWSVETTFQECWSVNRLNSNLHNLDFSKISFWKVNLLTKWRYHPWWHMRWCQSWTLIGSYCIWVSGWRSSSRQVCPQSTDPDFESDHFYDVFGLFLIPNIECSRNYHLTITEAFADNEDFLVGHVKYGGNQENV